MYLHSKSVALTWQAVGFCCLGCCSAPSVRLCLVQEKAEGEPKQKKGKTLLGDDDDDGGDHEEGLDESPEEVRDQSLIVSFISAFSLWQNTGGKDEEQQDVVYEMFFRPKSVLVKWSIASERDR